MEVLPGVGKPQPQSEQAHSTTFPPLRQNRYGCLVSGSITSRPSCSQIGVAMDLLLWILAIVLVVLVIVFLARRV